MFVFSLFSPMQRSTGWPCGSPAQVHGLFKLKTHEENNSADPATHAKVDTTAMQCHILQHWNALDAGQQNAKDTNFCVIFWKSTKSGREKYNWTWQVKHWPQSLAGVSELPQIWTLWFLTSWKKISIAYLSLHFMQGVRILKGNKCSLAQMHWEVSEFGLWTVQFSALFSLGWFLCYSEVEGGREITFFHPHLFQVSISISTCTSSTAENCFIAPLLRRKTQSPLEKRFVKCIPKVHTSSYRSLLYYYIMCWGNHLFS